MGKNKKGPLNVYEITLQKVRDYIKDIPGMTLTRFYDDAVNEKLKTIYEQNARSTSGGTNNSESPKI